MVVLLRTGLGKGQDWALRELRGDVEIIQMKYEVSWAREFLWKMMKHSHSEYILTI